MKILDVLLEITIYSGILFFAIMLLKLGFRSRMSPFLNFAIWGLLIARLMIPVTLESSIHLIVIPAKIQDTAVLGQAQSPAPDPDTALNPDPSGYAQLQAGGSRQGQTEATPVTPQDDTPAIRRAFSLSAEQIILTLWLTGVGAGLLYLAILYGILRRHIRGNAQPPSGRLLKLFDEVKGELNIKRNVGIIGQCEYGTPAVLFPNTVLMPVSALVSMDDEQVKYVLRHELMHLKRGDHIMGLLLSLLNAVHWFNPIVWIAFKQVRADMETACDSDVVRCFTSNEKTSYAAVILSLFSKKQYGNLVLGMVQGNTKKIAEKRIKGVFMHRRTGKKVKITAVLLTGLLLFSCFTTACQPTPQELVVQNKADDELENAIAQTATPAASQTLEPVMDHITQTVTNQSDTVTVNIDADIMKPDISKIPVAQVEQTTVSIDRIEQIVKAFYGNAKLYDTVATKADIQATILKMQLKLTDDEALLNSDLASGSGSTDLEELRKLLNERIEQQKKLLQDAPEERPEIHGFDGALTQRGLVACVDIAKDYMGYIETSVSDSFGQRISLHAFGGEYPQHDRSLIPMFSTPISLNMSDTEFQNAKHMAEMMMNDMGIDGVVLGEAYLSEDYTGIGNPGVTSDREFYVFCFERVVGEGTVDFNFITNLRNDSKTEVYERVLPYETMQIWMEGDEFRQFVWYSPMSVKEMINDNVALAVDSEQAAQLMQQQAFIRFIDAQDERDALFSAYEVDIHSIDLELVRIKQRDTGHYLIVPAWVFHGQVNGAITQLYIDMMKDEDLKVGEYVAADIFWLSGDAIMTINALDASVIDVDAGY